MTHPFSASKKTTSGDRPLIGRSTIVILLSYQFGMMLGNGIPTTLKSLTLLAASTVLIAYLVCVLFRSEKRQRQQASKHKKMAVQVSRRIRKHIVDQPSEVRPTSSQPRRRTHTEFAPVVSSWG